MDKAPLVARSPRHAALLVHAMARPDQEWLLASLAPHHRVELEGLLEELATLGIAPDDAVLRQVIQTKEDGAQPRREGAVARLERLAPAQVEGLVQLLRAEPPSVAAGLLAAHPWPWKHAVLQALPAAAADPRPQAAALQQAICESILRHVEAHPEVAAPAPRRWTRWLPARRGKARP